MIPSGDHEAATQILSRTAVLFLSPPVSPAKMGGLAFSTCARATRGVRDRALREHVGNRQASLLFLLSFYSHLPLEGVGRWSSTARIEGPPLYRGASASTEDHLAAPAPPLTPVLPRPYNTLSSG